MSLCRKNPRVWQAQLQWAHLLQVVIATSSTVALKARLVVPVHTRITVRWWWRKVSAVGFADEPTIITGDWSILPVTLDAGRRQRLPAVFTRELTEEPPHADAWELASAMGHYDLLLDGSLGVYTGKSTQEGSKLMLGVEAQPDAHMPAEQWDQAYPAFQLQAEASVGLSAESGGG